MFPYNFYLSFLRLKYNSPLNFSSNLQFLKLQVKCSFVQNYFVVFI